MENNEITINNGEESAVLSFDKLRSKVNFSREEAIKPVFFMPGHLPDEMIERFEEEPFNAVVFPYCNMYIDFVGSEDSINKMASAIIDQAAAQFITNANIIFDSCFLKHLKSHVAEENVVKVMEIYNRRIPTAYANFTIIEVFENMKRYYAEENRNTEYMNSMVLLFTKSRAALARYLSNEVYKFLNEVIMLGYINTSSYVFEAYKRQDISACNSVLSYGIMDFLSLAAGDIDRILEMFELILVNAFYRLTDLLDYARKNNIKLKPSYPAGEDFFPGVQF